jgi:hypothetical protein
VYRAIYCSGCVKLRSGFKTRMARAARPVRVDR